MARTITVTLTDTQFTALAGAVDVMEQEAENNWHDVSVRNRQRALNNAWDKIRDAWYSPVKRRRP